MSRATHGLNARLADLLIVGTLIFIPGSLSQGSVVGDSFSDRPRRNRVLEDIPSFSTESVIRVSELLSDLPVMPPIDIPYDRRLFGDWIDADRDGCDTREEVLVLQSLKPADGESSCVPNGLWLSFYDNITTEEPSDLEIDHLVPLKEAWVSGAARWSRQRLREYFNDTSVDGALIAVSRSSNRAKGARDPAEWLPGSPTARCRYATTWIEVKHRWQLHVDLAEVSILRALLSECGLK